MSEGNPQNKTNHTPEGGGGFKNIKVDYKQRTVGGSFENQSLSGKIKKSVQEKSPGSALKKTTTTFSNTSGGGVVQRLPNKGGVAKEGGKEIDIAMSYQKKLQGPMFWFMMMLVMIKDVLDLVFTFTVFLVFLASAFAVMTSLSVIFYLKYNEVPFTTRKLATMAITFIVEFLPFMGLLPMATLNLVLVRMIDNNERLSKLVEKGAFALQ